MVRQSACQTSCTARVSFGPFLLRPKNLPTVQRVTTPPPPPPLVPERDSLGLVFMISKRCFVISPSSSSSSSFRIFSCLVVSVDVAFFHFNLQQNIAPAGTRNSIDEGLASDGVRSDCTPSFAHTDVFSPFVSISRSPLMVLLVVNIIALTCGSLKRSQGD